jgi:hypothetical protein
MAFFAYSFGAKYFNNNHQLPNNLHLKYVSLKYQFYKQFKKETKKFIHNTSKIMEKFFPSIFLMCTLLSLSTIASLGIGITNTLEKFIISYCSPKIAFLIFLTKIINCNNSANVIHVYQLHILCIELRVKKTLVYHQLLTHLQ